MAISAESSSSFDPAALLARQRNAFVSEGPPSVQQRKERLARLRAVVLAYRSEVEEAVSADFGTARGTRPRSWNWSA